jgi:hypothetical protein
LNEITLDEILGDVKAVDEMVSYRITVFGTVF